jgi:hypothetical protein
MSAEYILSIATDLEPQSVMKMLFREDQIQELKRDEALSRYFFVEEEHFICICVSSSADDFEDSLVTYFDIDEPTLEIEVQLLVRPKPNKSDHRTFHEVTVDIAARWLAATNDDIVITKPGDTTILYRAKGKLTLNKDHRLWQEPKYLAQITVPFELTTIPVSW